MALETVPAVGDKATAAWADAVANWVNNPPRMQATQTTTGTTIPAAGFGALAGFTTDVDSFGSSFNAATGVWTCPTSGQYELNGQLTIVSGTARLIAAFTKNGVATVLYSVFLTGTASTAATAVLAPKEFAFVAGDTVQLAGNSATATTTTSANNNASYMRIKRLT